MSSALSETLQGDTSCLRGPAALHRGCQALQWSPHLLQVRDFQAVIGRETRQQCLEKLGRDPDVLLACVGGGSNAIGLFHEFVDDAHVRLIGELGLQVGQACGASRHSCAFVVASAAALADALGQFPSLEGRAICCCGLCCPCGPITQALQEAAVVYDMQAGWFVTVQQMQQQLQNSPLLPAAGVQVAGKGAHHKPLQYPTTSGACCRKSCSGQGYAHVMCHTSGVAHI